MTNKYFVIDGNGKKHTRNTHRVYTHVVLYRLSKEATIRLANVRPHWLRENFWYHHAFLDGSSKWLERAPHEKDDAQFKRRVEQDIERARYFLRGCATPDELWNLNLADALSAIEKIDFTAWDVEGWCGRHDLAVKLAHKKVCRERVAETIILLVSV
jgi:hypothetical protein